MPVLLDELAGEFVQFPGVNGHLIFRKSAPRVIRSRCWAMRNGRPPRTRIVSNSPSPYMKPRSLMGTTAWASGTNWPLRKTIMGLNSWQPFNYLKYCDFASRKIPMANPQARAGTGIISRGMGNWSESRKPAAFARVSSYSASGFESATMPAPTLKIHLPVLANRRADGDA